MFKQLKEKMYREYGKFVSIPIILISLGVIQLSGLTTIEKVSTRGIVTAAVTFLAGVIMLVVFRMRAKNKSMK